MNRDSTELRWNRYATVLPARKHTYVLLEDRGQVLKIENALQFGSTLEALRTQSVDGLDRLKGELVAVGALVARGHDERAAVLDVARRAEEARNVGATKMHLFMTHACNFRCSYCIQGHSIKAERPGIIDRERVDAAFQALGMIVDAIPRGRFPESVTLFGGEPMLPSTRLPFLHAVGRAVDLGLRVVTVTNGYYYDRFRDSLRSKGLLSQMQYLVSLDGPPSVHNRRRVLVSGGGTFSSVAKSIDRMLEDGAAVKLQPIIDSENVDELDAIYAIAEQRGWVDSGRFEIRCGITMYPNAQAFRSEKGSHERYVLGKVIRFSEAHEGVDAGFDAVLKRSHFLDTVLREGRNVHVNAGCDAKRAGALSFSPDGFVYPCREYAGHGARRAIARYHPNVEIFDDNFRSWFGWRASTHPKCGRCKHLLLCGGGCRVETETRGFDESVDPLCPDFEEVWRAYLDHVDGERVDERPVAR